MSTNGSAPVQATAQIGGVPTIDLDVPICAVFLGLFVGLAAGHMTLFRRNLSRGHKFIFNAMCFGFSVSRIMACMFRLIWATRPTNADISLVASVFLNAGILIVYIINIFFAWRLVRSVAPSVGWNPILRMMNRISLWAIIGFIVPLIVIIILRVKAPTTPGVSTGTTVVSRMAQTYFLLLCVEAAVLLTFAAITARSKEVSDPFGKHPYHSWHVKLLILTTTVILATIEAGFRCGTTWAPAPLASDPAWWDSKAAFYCFNFAIDVLLLAVLLVGRVDQRFHVPNQANGPGSYSRVEGDVAEKGAELESRVPTDDSGVTNVYAA